MHDEGCEESGGREVSAEHQAVKWLDAAAELERQLAAERARAEKAEARCAALEAAVKWALGEIGEFPPYEEGQPRYFWRTELRRRAAIATRIMEGK